MEGPDSQPADPQLHPVIEHLNGEITDLAESDQHQNAPTPLPDELVAALRRARTTHTPQNATTTATSTSQ